MGWRRHQIASASSALVMAGVFEFKGAARREGAEYEVVSDGSRHPVRRTPQLQSQACKKFVVEAL